MRLLLLLLLCASDVLNDYQVFTGHHDDCQLLLLLWG